jgi:plasmid stabilization system protein ParE
LKPVSITPLAQREIDAAASFYEGRKEGLGMEFADRVDEALQSIEIAPSGFERIYGDLRRCGLRQFVDWALWYRVLPDQSIVVACLSGRRHPRVAKERAAGVTDQTA